MRIYSSDVLSNFFLFINEIPFSHLHPLNAYSLLYHLFLQYIPNFHFSGYSPFQCLLHLNRSQLCYFSSRTYAFFKYLQPLDNQLPHWFKKKILFFNNYEEGIKNFFLLPYSNGITGGLNNKIKVIKRIANGYRNFYHFRLHICIIQGLTFSRQKKA
ncbi:transposase [Enterococcus plantarum]|nr:transposase [Enterococcus plantarum]